MAEQSHGTGGLTFDASKRRLPPEAGVAIALVVIVVAFELLGRYLMNDSFLFNTRDDVSGLFNVARLKIIILQVSIIGIIALGVTQVIITGGIDLSAGSVVGATAMIAMSFAQVGQINAQLLADADALALIVGDFNFEPGSPGHDAMTARWLDTADAFGDAQPTFPSNPPAKRIDYIFVHPVDRWRIIEARVLDEPLASDHAPLLVVLELVE